MTDRTMIEEPCDKLGQAQGAGAIVSCLAPNASVFNLTPLLSTRGIRGLVSDGFGKHAAGWTITDKQASSPLCTEGSYRTSFDLQPSA